MASIAAHRRRIGELVALVWLVTEVARLVRARVEAPSGGREHTRTKERRKWRK
jgi:hypothetical protein